MIYCPKCRAPLSTQEIRVTLGMHGSEERLLFWCYLCKADITLSRELYRLLIKIFSS